jgi:sirohydrochlorin cobaltochelatase
MEFLFPTLLPHHRHPGGRNSRVALQKDSPQRSLRKTQRKANKMIKAKDSPKRVILLVAFGTIVAEAAKAFDAIEAEVRAKYERVEVRWAFTSKTVRSRLADRGRVVDSPEIALARLMDEGYTHAAVLSLHVVPGEEYEALYRNAMCFQDMTGGFEKILIARPLLGNREDIALVGEILSKEFEPQKRDQGVVFIGHGNPRHSSDAIYTAMNSLFMDRYPGRFVGTVDGHLTPNILLPKIIAAGIRKARLIPLMTTAGYHARMDMAGENPESWQSVLSQNGVVSEPILRGLAEDPDIVSVWLDHLEEVFSKL